MRIVPMIAALGVVVALPVGCSKHHDEPKREVSAGGPRPSHFGLAERAASGAAAIGSCEDGCRAVVACRIVADVDCDRVCRPGGGGTALGRVEGVACDELTAALAAVGVGTCEGSCSRVAACGVSRVRDCIRQCDAQPRTVADLARAQLASCAELRQQAGLPPDPDDPRAGR